MNIAWHHVSLRFTLNNSNTYTPARWVNCFFFLFFLLLYQWFSLVVFYFTYLISCPFCRSKTTLITWLIKKKTTSSIHKPQALIATAAKFWRWEHNSIERMYTTFLRLRFIHHIQLIQFYGSRPEVASAIIIFFGNKRFHNDTFSFPLFCLLYKYTPLSYPKA